MTTGFRIPDVDLSAVLQPLCFDSFLDANGTSLDAHTPDVDDVGGGWTSARWNTGVGPGAGDIQGNQARLTTQEGGFVIDAGVGDAIAVVDWATAVAVPNRNGLVLRYQQDGDMWAYAVREDNNDVRILERNGNATTERASAVVVINEGVTYRLVAICDDEDITCFIDGGDRITYGSAAFLKTETEFGIVRFSGDDATRLDNFHVHTRRSAVYDTTFGAY